MSSHKSIIFVAGARPNFMKIAPIIHALQARSDAPPWQLVHTGQHYDPSMSDVFFEQLRIPKPHKHLHVGSGSHGAQTAAILVGFEKYLQELPELPGAVIVVGDVNSTVACALAAVKMHIPVVHVEAGLRSFDRSMPEEINRLATDAIADLLLVSEPNGMTHLKNEGVSEERVRFVGNVMIDSLVAELPSARALNQCQVLQLDSGRYAFVTLHRPSNVDEAARLTAVVAFLEDLASKLPVVFPLHPRTREKLKQFELWERIASISALRILEPLAYRESLSLMATAKLVVTDSGGIQEETSYLRIPCLTLRPNTERPITVSHGTSTVGEDLNRARETVDAILAGQYKKGQDIEGWDGHAAERVIDAVVELLV